MIEAALATIGAAFLACLLVAVIIGSIMYLMDNWYRIRNWWEER